MIKLTIKLGNQVLSYEDNDIRKVHKFSAIYGMLPSVCDCCKSQNLYLSHKAPKGNDYYLIACKDCGAELTFHQKKEGGFFLKPDEKMSVYQRQQSQAEQAINGVFNGGQKVDIDDGIPF